MAELNPPLGTTTPEIFLDNVKRADELVNGPAGTVNDRGGEPLDTWRQMMAKNDEIRQNLIPLSKQYATLAAAQADIVNIPVGSTTYYRSPDDSALAVEVMNVAGRCSQPGARCHPCLPSQVSGFSEDMGLMNLSLLVLIIRSLNMVPTVTGCAMLEPTLNTVMAYRENHWQSSVQTAR